LINISIVFRIIVVVIIKLLAHCLHFQSLYKILLDITMKLEFF